MKSRVLLLSILFLLLNLTLHASSFIDISNTKKIKTMMVLVKENNLDGFFKEFASTDSLIYYFFKSNLFDSTQYDKMLHDNNSLKSIEFNYKKETASTFVQLRYFELFEGNWNHIYFDKAYKIDEQKKNGINTSVYFLPLRDSLHKKNYTLEIEVDNFSYQNKFGDIRVSDIYSNMYLTKLSDRKKDDGILPITEFDNAKIIDVDRKEDKIIDTIITTYANNAYLLKDVKLRKSGLNYFVKVNLNDINNNKIFEFTSHDDIKFGINVVNEDNRYSSITFLNAEIHYHSYLIYTVNGNKFCGILLNKDFDFTNPIEILLNKM